MFSSKNLLHCRTSRFVRRHSYHDQVQYDAHNSSFFIYYLGHYNNRPIFHYGETNDVVAKEFMLRKTLPHYERIRIVPIEHCVDGKKRLDEYISNHNIQIHIPVIGMTDLEALTTSEDVSIDQIMATVDSIYNMIEYT